MVGIQTHLHKRLYLIRAYLSIKINSCAFDSKSCVFCARISMQLSSFFQFDENDIELELSLS